MNLSISAWLIGCLKAMHASTSSRRSHIRRVFTWSGVVTDGGMSVVIFIFGASAPCEAVTERQCGRRDEV
jgi:hypothetical protein